MSLWMEGQIRSPTAHNGRRQAAKQVKQACENCQLPMLLTRLVVHHRDEDPLNNEPSNLMTLCGSCHRRAHAPNFTATGTRRAPCKRCTAPSVKLGLCETHLSRLRRYGHALAKKRKVGSGWQLMLHDGRAWMPFPSVPTSSPESDACAPTATPS